MGRYRNVPFQLPKWNGLWNGIYELGFTTRASLLQQLLCSRSKLLAGVRLYSRLLWWFRCWNRGELPWTVVQVCCAGAGVLVHLTLLLWQYSTYRWLEYGSAPESRTRGRGYTIMNNHGVCGVRVRGFAPTVCLPWWSRSNATEHRALSTALYKNRGRVSVSDLLSRVCLVLCSGSSLFILSADLVEQLSLVPATLISWL
jgi:hypothetical protein